MKSKISELGVFTVGLGIILAALSLYLVVMIRPTQSPSIPSTTRFALAVVPGAVMAAVGSLVLIFRNRTTVKITVAVVTLAFVADALIDINPIRWFISVACLFLIWRTGRQALDEIDDGATLRSGASAKSQHDDVESGGSTRKSTTCPVCGILLTKMERSGELCPKCNASLHVPEIKTS